MNEKTRRQVIELVKDVLIIFLAASALWLAARTRLALPFGTLFREEVPQISVGQGANGGQVGHVVPMIMAVNLNIGSEGESVGLPSGEGIRMGIFHNQPACQALYEQVAGTLIEVLSSAEEPERVSLGAWQAALGDQTSVYMDFQGEIPLPVLVGWLSGESTALEGSVRKLALSVWKNQTALYYRNEEDGLYYRACSAMADPKALESTLAGIADNGAFYAFESEQYQSLAEDTLLFAESPSLDIYTVSNPVSGGEAMLEELVRDIGFPVNSTSIYATDDLVARSGGDNVRLSDRGVVEYSAGDHGELLPILRQGEAGTLFDSVETCHQVVTAVMGSRCGEAQIYLSGVKETDAGLEINFEYSLNGIPVHLEQGHAASFLVANGKIGRFTMRFRNYAPSGAVSGVLPPKQAAAAFSALELDGEELMITYTDDGSDMLSAGWAARGVNIKEQ